MTKQDDIRDGVILNITKAFPDKLNRDAVELADKILKDEDSQGVVVRVEKELPNDEWLANLRPLIDPTSFYYFKEWTANDRGQTVGERQLRSYFGQAGFEAVETLRR